MGWRAGRRGSKAYLSTSLRFPALLAPSPAPSAPSQQTIAPSCRAAPSRCRTLSPPMCSPKNEPSSFEDERSSANDKVKLRI